MDGRKRLLGAAPGVGGGSRSNTPPRSSKYQRTLPAIDRDSVYRQVVDGGAPTPRYLSGGLAMERRIPWQEADSGGPEAVVKQRENRLTRRAADVSVRVLVSFRVESKAIAEERLERFRPPGSAIEVQSGAAAPKFELARGDDGVVSFIVGLNKYVTVYEATATLTQLGEGGGKVSFTALGTNAEQATQLSCYGAAHMLRDSAIVLGAPTVRDFTTALPTMLRLHDPRVDDIIAQPPVGGWPAPLPPPQPITDKPKAKAKAKPVQQQPVAAAAAKKPRRQAKQQQPTHAERLLRVLEENAANCRRAGVNYRTHRVAVPTLIKLRGDEVGTPPNMGVQDCTVSLERGVVAKGQRQLKALFPGAKLRPAAPNDPRVREFGIYLEVNQGAVQEVVFEVGRVLRLYKGSASSVNFVARQQWRGVVAWATTPSAALDEAAFQLTKRLDDAAKLSRTPGVEDYARKRGQIRGLLATV